MRRVDRPTTVEIQYALDGTFSVQSFLWRETVVSVTSTGRSWLSEDGRHVLVMDPASRVFELLLRKSDSSWRVVGTPTDEFLV